METRVYVNGRTGATVETSCLCAGGEWRELKPPKEKKRSGKGEKAGGELRDDGGPADAVAASLEV